MKKFLTCLLPFILFCIPCLSGSTAYAKTYSQNMDDAYLKNSTDSADKYPGEIQAQYTSEELDGTIAGICMGKEYACVYTYSSYSLVDVNKQWEIVDTCKFDHPGIKKDAVVPLQIINQDGTFYFLLFDHSVAKSYVLIQPEEGKPSYGRLYSSEIKAFLVLDDGFFFAGCNKKGNEWLACTDRSFGKRWELTLDSSFVPIYSFLDDQNICVISRPSAPEAYFQILMLTLDGQEHRRIDIRPESGVGVTSHHEVTAVKFDGTNVLLSGYLNNGQSTNGFFLRLNQGFSVEEDMLYEKFNRIQTFCTCDERAIMLAFPSPGTILPDEGKRSYIIPDISSDAVIPLETQSSYYRTAGLIDVDDSIYCYGRKYNELSPTCEDSFIAKIELD